MKKALLLMLSAFAIVTAKAQQTDTTAQNQPFVAVEQTPDFPGGPNAFLAYLAKNLKYPKKAIADKTEGKVFVSFIVEKDGSLSDIKIIRSVSPEIDAEALRVIKNSPRWKPGIQNGRAVKVANTLPISFKLPTYAQPDSLKVFTSVEQKPTFPGGEVKFSEFLKANLIYPPAARKIGVHGKVFLNFIVEKDGSLTDIKIVKGIGVGCDEEAMRVLSGSPKWNPGMQNGHPVRVYYTMPVSFELPSK